MLRHSKREEALFPHIILPLSRHGAKTPFAKQTNLKEGPCWKVILSKLGVFSSWHIFRPISCSKQFSGRMCTPAATSPPKASGRCAPCRTSPRRRPGDPEPVWAEEKIEGSTRKSESSSKSHLVVLVAFGLCGFPLAESLPWGMFGAFCQSTKQSSIHQPEVLGRLHATS